MTAKKIFVDLDRTILDTGVFVAELWQYLGRNYGIDVEVERVRSQQFYTYDGDLYDYHLFDHLADLKIGDVADLRFKLTLHMQKQFLLFNDTDDGLEALQQLGGFTIMTFGNEPYQQFKIACVPELARYKVICVQKHKKHYFTDTFTEPCILIDDKNLAGSLPSNVDFVLIDRTQPLPVQRHDGYVSIRKLQNIKQVIHEL